MKRKWLEIIINSLFWGLSTWLILSFFTIEQIEVELIDGQEVERVRHNSQLAIFFLIGQGLYSIFFYLHLKNIHQLTKQASIQTQLLYSFLYAILILSCYYGITTYIYPQVLFFPAISYGIFLFYLGIATAYGFVKGWIKNEQDKAQLELVKNKAELELLRSQLHPHFLFNTMNNLLAMVDQQANPKLAQSIDKLSNLLRYVVYDTKQAKSSIAREIDFIENFAQLHLLRFEEDEIDYRLTVKGEHTQQPIETGILLCFVENAFKHGVEPESSSFIHIEVDVSAPNQVIFSIENSLVSDMLQQEVGGYGLKAVKERLALTYPNQHILDITSDQTYCVKLSLINHESDHC